ncbi:MAG: putative peroxidase-related enzyme [Bacteriovoracaceae bacterium]|jgi:uncharacterized peroxidase-related enzyme
MAYLKSLPVKAHIADVFQRFKKGVPELLEFHDLYLRSDSSLSVGEREMIAAFVSVLNGCQFCFGSHSRIAALYNIQPSLFPQLITDIDSAKIEENFKPILKYVKKLTLTPSKVTQADIDLILEQGWSEEAVHTSATICALFNFMNRLVDGLGVSEQSIATKSLKGDGHLSKTSYKDFGRSAGLI